MAVKVALNGFGRIGRTVLRAWATGRNPAARQIEIVAVNDIAAPEMCAYLFEYDSVFGRWPGQVGLGEGRLQVDGHSLRLTRESDLGVLDLSDCDLVLECTGRGDQPGVAGRALASGARRVLISGPSRHAELTLVLGANDHLLAGQTVVSNASCTTNALAPLARVLDRAFGIETGWMTTIHCYTGSQPSVDAPAADFARSRAAALSMVPTTTSAQRLLDMVLPDLAGRLDGAAVRVPVASVSAVDLTVMLRERPDAGAVNAALAAAGGVIGTTRQPLVSSDLRGRDESVVMALPETRVTPGGLVRVFGWYDNEWGFSNRMIEVAARMG